MSVFSPTPTIQGVFDPATLTYTEGVKYPETFNNKTKKDEKNNFTLYIHRYRQQPIRTGAKARYRRAIGLQQQPTVYALSDALWQGQTRCGLYS